MFYNRSRLIAMLAACGLATSGCEFLDDETVERVIEAAQNATGESGFEDEPAPDESEDAPLEPPENPDDQPSPGDGDDEGVEAADLPEDDLEDPCGEAFERCLAEAGIEGDAELFCDDEEVPGDEEDGVESGDENDGEEPAPIIEADHGEDPRDEDEVDGEDVPEGVYPEEDEPIEHSGDEAAFERCLMQLDMCDAGEHIHEDIIEDEAESSQCDRDLETCLDGLEPELDDESAADACFETHATCASAQHSEDPIEGALDTCEVDLDACLEALNPENAAESDFDACFMVHESCLAGVGEGDEPHPSISAEEEVNEE